MSDAPWYERFFGDNYLDVYGHQLSAEGAEHEASFVERALALKAGESLLDLCCGPGRRRRRRLPERPSSAEAVSPSVPIPAPSGRDLRTVAAV